MTIGARAAQSQARVALTLTGGFELCVGGSHVPVPHSVERLLAYLGLSATSVPRARLAGILWSETSQQRASNNLRTALWRLHVTDAPVVTSSQDLLALAPDVAVDVRDLLALSGRLIMSAGEECLGPARLLASHEEVLPDWEDVWVVAERERFRLLRLEALEGAANAMLEQGRPSDALATALDVVRSEPLRENAWRVVVRVHLAQGNLADALRAYHGYRSMLQEELGVRPSPLMRELVAELT
jgi:DNA-binding SARP family transcriptional activator